MKVNADKARTLAGWACSLAIVALVVIAVVSLIDHGIIG
jgi:hypothetical protein